LLIYKIILIFFCYLEKASKRVSLGTKYKIQKRVREFKRKQKKLLKKGGSIPGKHKCK
jgi:hypothetical protein